MGCDEKRRIEMTNCIFTALQKSGVFRCNNRIPAVCWASPNGVSISRTSQPHSKSSLASFPSLLSALFPIPLLLLSIPFFHLNDISAGIWSARSEDDELLVRGIFAVSFGCFLFFFFFFCFFFVIFFTVTFAFLNPFLMRCSRIMQTMLNGRCIF